MKPRALLFLFFLGMMQTVSAQTYSTAIVDNDIYSFLEWMAQNDKKLEKSFAKKEKKLSAKIIPWKREYLNIIYSHPVIDSLLTEQDKSFVFEQVAAISNDVWQKNIGGKKPEKPDKQGSNTLRYYSVPLYSLDKEYIFMYRGYDCGYDCITGRCILYKKDEDRWRLMASVPIEDSLSNF